MKCLALCISYSMVTEYNQKRGLAINPLIVSLVSLCSYLYSKALPYHELVEYIKREGKYIESKTLAG
jgi:hypothetical protein